MMAFLKAFFRSIGKAFDWFIGGDDEKLRAARARGQKPGDASEADREEKEIMEKELSATERYAQEYDVWEEIDSYRTTFWFGSKMGKMLTRSRRRDKKLEEELDELARKRQEKEEKEKDSA